MKSAEDIRKYFQRSTLSTNPDKHEAIFEKIRHAQDQSPDTAPALSGPKMRNIIMKSPITKLAAAAAIVVLVVLGLLEFIGDGGTSGVVWAEVARNVEASRGVIFRTRGTGSRDPNDDWPDSYMITWRCPAITRTDRYRGGKIWRTIYYNLDTKTVIGVLHDAQRYSREAMSDERVQRARADKDRWSTPQSLISHLLALKHHSLDQKMIDGVLCEGIETTDASGLPFKSFTARGWVSVETGYPVLGQVEVVDDAGIRRTTTLDQFQWNVDLSIEDVEPEIPADYESLGLEGEMKTLSEQGEKELLKVEITMTDGILEQRVHVYKYELSDGRTTEMREGVAGGAYALSEELWQEWLQLRAGPGEDLGTYEETVEGRVFSFKREKYVLSDGTEVTYSVGTPKDSQ